MQSSTMTSPFRLPPAEPRRSAAGNEFSAAVAKLIERRGQVVVERPPLPPRVDASGEDLDAARRRWLPRSFTARGVLVALPAIALAMSAVWLFTGGAAPLPTRSIRTTLPRPTPIAPASVAAAVPAPSPARAETPPPLPVVPSPPLPDPAPPVAASVTPAPSLPLTRDEVREVQSRLTALGFAAGPADGVAGPQTQAALRRYGEARRLPGSDLDRALLVRLRGEPARSR